MIKVFRVDKHRFQDDSTVDHTIAHWNAFSASSLYIGITYLRIRVIGKEEDVTISIRLSIWIIKELIVCEDKIIYSSDCFWLLRDGNPPTIFLASLIPGRPEMHTKNICSSKCRREIDFNRSSSIILYCAKCGNGTEHKNELIRADYLHTFGKIKPCLSYSSNSKKYCIFRWGSRQIIYFWSTRRNDYLFGWLNAAKYILNNFSQASI